MVIRNTTISGRYFISTDQIQSNYYDKRDCDNKIDQLQSDKTLCDATAAVLSLVYAVNTYTTRTETNILSKQVSVFESQITEL